ncbi:MAG: hypothetical protein MJA83_14840, partial [Gammaproteobacteria bacterium]|nr:hypothetical protein [Gammaproteobacteria bacterium]
MSKLRFSVLFTGLSLLLGAHQTFSAPEPPRLLYMEIDAHRLGTPSLFKKYYRVESDEGLCKNWKDDEFFPGLNNPVFDSMTLSGTHFLIKDPNSLHPPPFDVYREGALCTIYYSANGCQNCAQDVYFANAIPGIDCPDGYTKDPQTDECIPPDPDPINHG